MERIIALIILSFILFILFRFQVEKFIKTIKMPLWVSRLRGDSLWKNILIILLKIGVFFVVLIIQLIRFCFKTAWETTKRL